MEKYFIKKCPSSKKCCRRQLPTSPTPMTSPANITVRGLSAESRISAIISFAYSKRSLFDRLKIIPAWHWQHTLEKLKLHICQMRQLYRQLISTTNNLLIAYWNYSKTFLHLCILHSGPVIIFLLSKLSTISKK